MVARLPTATARLAQLAHALLFGSSRGPGLRPSTFDSVGDRAQIARCCVKTSSGLLSIITITPPYHIYTIVVACSTRSTTAPILCLLLWVTPRTHKHLGYALPGGSTFHTGSGACNATQPQCQVVLTTPLAQPRRSNSLSRSLSRPHLRNSPSLEGKRTDLPLGIPYFPHDNILNNKERHQYRHQR